LVIGVDQYYERVAPLVACTIEATAQVMSTTGESAAEALKEVAREAGVAGIYVVGGASALPIVPRMLRAELGRRVHRSTYPAGSIAIGLAIAAASAEEPSLRERLSRHLGVFREAESGRRIVFDRIFARGTPMPDPGGAPLVATRTYRAAHTVGFFRFVECAAVDGAGEPAGDITPHASVAFPFIPTLRDDPAQKTPVERLSGEGPPIEERYEVDAAGVVKVTIRDLEDGFSREYVL
jgi:molecular chaperone DnaK (HSP70)